MMKVEELRSLTHTRVDVDGRTMSGTHVPAGVAGSDGATGWQGAQDRFALEGF